MIIKKDKNLFFLEETTEGNPVLVSSEGYLFSLEQITSVRKALEFMESIGQHEIDKSNALTLLKFSGERALWAHYEEIAEHPEIVTITPKRERPSFVPRIRPGVVYFVEREDGLTKIGFSGKFEDRIKALQKTYGNLKVIGLIESEDAPYAEYLAHMRLAKYWVEKEFFRLTPQKIVEGMEWVRRNIV